jgi:hypothetical protein
VDLEAGTISVWRSVRAHGDTKTNRSRRTLKLPEIAAVGAEGFRRTCCGGAVAADRQPRPFGSPILAAARRGTNHGHAVTRRAKWASELPR